MPYLKGKLSAGGRRVRRGERAALTPWPTVLESPVDQPVRCETKNGRREHTIPARRLTRQVRVGKVLMGGGAPVVLQSMTSTVTCDIDATVAQVNHLATAGCDVVRVAVPTKEDTAALPEIIRQSPVPSWPTFTSTISGPWRQSRPGWPRSVSTRQHQGPQAGQRGDRGLQAAGIPVRVGVNEGSVVERQDKAVREAEKSELARDYHTNLVQLMVASWKSICASSRSTVSRMLFWRPEPGPDDRDRRLPRDQPAVRFPAAPGCNPRRAA